jgi:PAS domain S-box-containing protein
MWVERRAGNLIAGHLLLPDVSGRPALVLTFEEGLDAGSYGRMMLYSLSTVLAVGALVLFLTILMGVEVMVLSRINSLRRQVGEVGSSADAAMRVKLEGHDEVAELAESINGMLAGLQEAHESLQRQEHELRQSEERYRSIFETAGTANVIVDADMTVLLVNPEFERLFGYSRADLEGKRKWSEFISEPDLGRMIEFNRLRQVAAGAAPRSYESSGNDRSGNLRDLLITVSPIPGTSRFIASALDITRRKRMEEELRQLKDFNEGIVEGVAEGLLIEDGAGKISFVNRALETMLGYSRSELVGWSWTRIVAPDQVNVIRERMSARGPGSSDVYETRFLDKAGRELPVLVSARPMQEDGHYAGVLTAVTDMREREKLEERLRQAQKLEMLGVIAGGIAHSFNNLLTVIRGNAELGLMEPDVPETLRHDLQVITGAAQRGALLTQQLLSFSRRRVLQPVPTDLNQRVAEFVELIRPLLGGDIQVAVDLAPGPCTILADASAIEQVLMNLSVNARDAMPQGGTLSVRTAERTVGEGDPDCRPGHGPGRYVLLSVSDTGQGIEPEAMAHLFEPFFSTKEVGKGTGLGLSVAYGIVQQHQGCIDVHSVPGQGARFDVYFPLFQKT